MLRRMTFMALAICLCASPTLAAPLHDAALKGDAAQMKALLAGGADANEKNRLGMTPIFYAAIKGSASGIEALAAGGADVNLRDKIGKAPLDWAAFRGHGAAVAALIRAGAKPDGRGAARLTAVLAGESPAGAILSLAP